MTHVDPSAIRQARRGRVRLIRRRAVAGAVALFIAIWLLIAGLLVTGHDPALARQASTSTTTTATSTTTSSASTTPSSTTSASQTSSSTNTSPGSGTSSVTSSQS